MLQNERIQDSSANDATPPNEHTGTGIILPVSEDFAHHGTMTAPTFHSGKVYRNCSNGITRGLPRFCREKPQASEIERRTADYGVVRPWAMAYFVNSAVVRKSNCSIICAL